MFVRFVDFSKVFDDVKFSENKRCLTCCPRTSGVRECIATGPKASGNKLKAQFN